MTTKQRVKTVYGGTILVDAGELAKARASGRGYVTRYNRNGKPIGCCHVANIVIGDAERQIHSFPDGSRAYTYREKE